MGACDTLPADNQDPQTVFQAGEVLNESYRIVRQVGEGGMGIVYEATHTRLAGRYAIKVLLQRLSDNPEALARFDREARITSSLQHPNIVQVVDFNRHTDGTEYLVMEYLQGESLAQRLQGGPLPVATVVAIVEQVAAGLAAAHEIDVVHRDLKPDNIFLLPVGGNRTEMAKVLDFGISKFTGASAGFLDPESGLIGTPQYMSPEQCRGRAGDVDGRSDQFALAAMTYEMLTGRTPFPGENVGAVLAGILYDRPEAMGVDPAVEWVVNRGLAKEKQNRYPSVTAFAESLRAAAMAPVSTNWMRPGGARPVAEFEDTETETSPLNLRRPWRTSALAFLGAAAVGATLFVVVGNKMDRWISVLRAPAATARVAERQTTTQVEAPKPVRPPSEPARPRLELAKPDLPPILLTSGAVDGRRLVNTDRRDAAPKARANANAAPRRATPARRLASRAGSRPGPAMGPPSVVNRPAGPPPAILDTDAPMPLDLSVGRGL